LAISTTECQLSLCRQVALFDSSEKAVLR